MKKKLAIDARLYKSGSGAGKICTATIDNFVEKYNNDYSEIVLYTNNKNTINHLKNKNNIKVKLININFIIYKFFLLPFYLKKDKIDILFSPTTDIPFFKLNKVIYINMVHDLFLEDIIDKDFGKKRGIIPGIKYFIKKRDIFGTFYALGLFKYCFKFSDKILSISNFTTKDIIKKYNIDNEKIELLYLGIDEIYYKYADNLNKIIDIKSKFNIKNKYIFTYDINSSYRNFSDTIYEFCKENNLTWVILNKNKDIYNEFKQTKAYGNAVFIRDFVSSEELISLISNSEFVFFPTPGEGFGLPIIETFSLGKKMLSINNTAIPEIGGKYINLYNNENDLYKNLENTLNREINKEEFINYCKTNFTWDIFSDNLNSLIKK